ncbi:MAG: Orotate phosphoribosyltransferase [Alphaproteobacteria bacterium ADurb.BinA280]|nr:MAG: Orotate phosphoribosyltransferase [Alphaproteobacteria bacterium ADurb.BinA280]
MLIALDRQERGQGERSAAQEVSAELGLPVIAVAGLNDLLAYTGESSAMQTHQSALLAYQARFGVAV